MAFASGDKQNNDNNNNHIKTTKFSLSDPVMIREFSKKLQSDRVLIQLKLASVLNQSDLDLTRAHLCCGVEISIGLDLDGTGSGLLRILLILNWIRAAKCSKNLGSGLDFD